MTKILSKCVYSMLGIIILISVVILPQQLIMAQTLEDILSERNTFKMNPQIKLDSGLSSIAVNSVTNKIYVTDKDSNTVSVIDSSSGNITKGIRVGIKPSFIAINEVENKIYVLNSGSNTVSVIDGATDKKDKPDIPVGLYPTAIAVNSRTGMTYVMNYNTVSVINNHNNKVSAGVTFNVSPVNSGTIVCNNKEYPTNTYLYVEAGIKCLATPNKDFEFSSWVENLGHNSSITLSSSSISDSPLNSFLRLLNIKPNDASATFVVDRYGSFTANFRHSPPAIPAEYWIPLYGIIVSTIVGWSVPSIIGWIKARRQGRRANQYYERINCLYNDGKLDEDDIADLDTLKKDITYVYTEGKISEQHYANLKSEISVLYEEIYKKKIESLDGKNSNDIILGKVKDEIKDGYAKGKISEQHYKLLNEKLSSKNNLTTTN